MIAWNDRGCREEGFACHSLQCNTSNFWPRRFPFFIVEQEKKQHVRINGRFKGWEATSKHLNGSGCFQEQGGKRLNKEWMLRGKQESWFWNKETSYISLAQYPSDIFTYSLFALSCFSPWAKCKDLDPCGRPAGQISEPTCARASQTSRHDLFGTFTGLTVQIRGDIQQNLRHIILANISSSTTEWMHCKRLKGCCVFLAPNESETDGRAQEASCGSWTVMYVCSTVTLCGRLLTRLDKNEYVQQGRRWCVIKRGTLN